MPNILYSTFSSFYSHPITFLMNIDSKEEKQLNINIQKYKYKVLKNFNGNLNGL